MTSRLEPRKGVRLALEALSRISEARLEILGDGRERQNLERLAGKLGIRNRVRFHGFVADPRQVMASADAALSSAAEEGLPLALLECMAAGLPVIAPPIGGIPECVQHNVSGWLSVDRSREALAVTMRRAMNRAVCRQVGASARTWVQQRSSLAAMDQAYGDLYTNLLGPAADRAPSGEPSVTRQDDGWRRAGESVEFRPR